MTAKNFTVDTGLTVSGTGGNITGATNIEASGSLTVHDGTFSGNINGSGGLDIDGNATIGGNLFVTGNINFSGNVTQITGNSGVFYGNVTTGVGAIYAGKTGYTPLPNTVVQITGDDNAYVQVNLQNTNHGNTASMEMAITADDGTDTTNYIDMGIASSTWDGTQDNSLGTAVNQRDGYLYVQGGSTGGNLILGTTTAGYKIKFNAGGSGAANTVATISNTGISTTGTVTATNIGNVAALNLNGNASTVLYGNGVFAAVAGGGSSYGDSNVVTLLSSFGSNTVSTTGNITAGNIGVGRVTATANITTTGYFISGNQATGGFQLGNVNSRITAGGSNSYATFGQNIALYPDTGLSGLAGILIGGNGYLLAPNGSRALTLSSDGSIAVNGNITQSLSGSQIISTSGLISAVGNITGGNLNTGANVVTTASGGGLRYFGGLSGNWNIYDHNTPTGGFKTLNIGTGQTISTSNTTINLGSQYGISYVNVYGNLVAANNTSLGNTATVTTSNYQIGYRDIPQIAFSANANAALTDAGKHYYSTTAGNLALTLPDNSTTAFPTGTAMTIVVQAAGNVLVNAGTGVSLYLGGNSTAGNRVVGPYGMATVMKVAANVWFINGTGVT